MRWLRIAAVGILAACSAAAQVVVPITVTKASGTNVLNGPIVIQPSGTGLSAGVGATVDFTGATVLGITASDINASAYSVLGNNTASTAAASSNQNFILGGLPPTDSNTPYYMGSIIASSVAQGNLYTLFAIQGKNSGADASTEFAINADNATSSTHSLAIGINSSGYTSGGTSSYPFVADAPFVLSLSDPLYVGTGNASSVTLFTNNIPFLTGSSAGVVALPLLTSNGLLQTSGSNGTVSVAASSAYVASVQGTTNQISPTTATTGAVTLSLSATLVLPGTVNGLTITTSASGVLTITAGKTLAATNSLTLSGTDGTTITTPSTSATMARTDAAQSFAGVQSFTNTTNSTNGTTGAVVVSGGIAAQEAVSVGGSLYTYGAPGNFGYAALGNPSETYTFTGTSGVTNFGIITFQTANFTNASANTITNLATVLIAGAPTVGGSQIGTNKYSLDVLGGASIFNGTLTAGATTIADATTPSITLATGETNTGFILINGKTSGSLKITTADATAQNEIVTLAAQTVGANTLTIPDCGGNGQTFAMVGLSQNLLNKTLTSAVIATGLTASGSGAINFSGNSGGFSTSTGANTISGAATFNSTITLGGTALNAGALPSGVTTTGSLATYSAQTYTVTGTNTATAYQGAYHGVVTVTDASVGTVTDLFDEDWVGPATNAGSLAATRKHTLGILGPTSAASSITGELIIATAYGTTATSIGLGGGNGNFGGTIVSGGAITSGSTITTAAGVTNAAGVWNLGALRSSTALVVSTTQVIQIAVGGTLYSLMTCTTNP